MSKGLNLADAYIEIKTKMDQYEREMAQVRKETDRTAESAERRFELMSKRLNSIAKVSAVGFGAMTAAGAGLVKLASDAVETQNKFEAVFKQLTADAEQWADKFSSAVGRSRTEVKSWMATLQDTFVPMGFTRQEALKLSTSLTGLAVDIASFNNAADAEVIQNLTSAIVGNHEAVRSYGIMITESRLKQEAINQGLGDNVLALTEAQKAWLRYQIILQSSQDAQGDATRTADEFANQLKALRSEARDLGEVLGQELIPVALDLVESARELVSAFSELDPETKKSIVQFGLFSTAALGLSAVLSPILATALSLSSAIAGAGGLTAALTGLATAFGPFAAGAAIVAGIAALANEMRKAREEAELLATNVNKVGDAEELNRLRSDLAKLREEKATRLQHLEEVDKQLANKNAEEAALPAILAPTPGYSELLTRQALDLDNQKAKVKDEVESLDRKIQTLETRIETLVARQRTEEIAAQAEEAATASSGPSVVPSDVLEAQKRADKLGGKTSFREIENVSQTEYWEAYFISRRILEEIADKEKEQLDAAVMAAVEQADLKRQGVLSGQIDPGDSPAYFRLLSETGLTANGIDQTGKGLADRAAREGLALGRMATIQAIEKASASQNAYTDIMAEHLEKMKDAVTLSRVLGEEYDLEAERSTILRQTIMQLVELGTEPAITAAEQLAKSLQNQSDATEEAAKLWGSTPSDWLGPIEEGLQSISAAFEESGSIMQQMAAGLIAQIRLQADEAGNISVNWDATMESVASSLINLVGGALGNLLTGSYATQYRGKTARGEENLPDMAQMMANYENWDENLRALKEKYASIDAATVGGAIGGAGVGAIFGPAGALIGGLLGGLLGRKSQAEKVAEDISKLDAKLQDTFAKIKEYLGTTMADVANSLAGAFSAETYGNFVDQFSSNLESQTKQALINAFMAGETMRPLIESLSNAVTAAAMDGEITGGERETIQEYMAEITSASADFYEMLQELGIATEGVTDQFNQLGESLRNMPSGYKIDIARWEATLPRYHSGGYVPRDMPAMLRRGEVVVTPEQISGSKGVNINLSVSVNGNVVGLPRFDQHVKDLVGQAAEEYQIIRHGATAVG